MLRAIVALSAFSIVLSLHAFEPVIDSIAVSDPPPVEVQQAEPIAAPSIRHFDEGALRAYRADPSLQFDLPKDVEPTWWDRFKAWLLELLESIFGSGPGRFLFGKLIWILVVLGALVLFFLAMRRGVFTGAFKGKPRSAVVVNDMHEELHAEDLGALVQQAEEVGEWRRAVRLRYLQVLRYGLDNDLLQWRPEYTDRDYSSQLSDPAKREAFGKIAFTFQWVWYGEAQLDRASYNQLTAPFAAFISRQAA